MQTAAGSAPLDDATRRQLFDDNHALAAEGFRVLAIAWRPEGWPAGDRVEDLTFLGLVALADPLRPGVREALGRCRVAGTATIMLTGDQRSTAEAIGRELGLTDDNFATIVVAVEEGRVIYGNLRKVIHFLFSCNLSEILTIFAAIVAGLPSPLAPLQILWVNLVTDILPAMALVRDPAEPDIMRRPPRDPREALVTRAFALRMLAEGACLAAGVLRAYIWVGLQEGVGPRAHTVAFVALVLIHPFQAMHCRSEHARFWRLPPNRLVWAALIALVLVQWGAVARPPLAGLLATVPLGARDWLLVAGAVLWPNGLLEATKRPRAEEG